MRMETLLKEARADVEINPVDWEHLEPVTNRDKRIKKLAAAARSGKPMVDVKKLILAGGSEEQNGNGWPQSGSIWWPNLAMARSTAETVTIIKDRNRKDLAFRSGNADTVLRLDWPWGKEFRARAITPIVPPKIREAVPSWHKDNKYIVWEATWTRLELPPRPEPLDPILLTHVMGDIYVVEAEWDMTDLEAYAASL
jgi:hypothetical protein